MTQPPAGYPPPERYEPPSEYELPPRHGQERPRYEYEYGPPGGATDPYGQPPVSGSPARPYDRPPYGQPPAGPPSSAPPYGQPPYGQPSPGPPYPQPPSGRPRPREYDQPSPPGQHLPPYDRTSAELPYRPADPPAGAATPGGATGGQPRWRSRGLLLIAAAVTGVLVLCGGGFGAWLIFRDGDRNGATSPAAAVQSFLQAVYRDKDPRQAAALVCAQARDERSLQAKINEIGAYEGTEANPAFQWTDPQVIEQTDELAVVEVTITMITADERIASQTMHVSVLDKEPHGWWVCDLETVGPPADEDSGEGEEGTEEDGSEEDG